MNKIVHINNRKKLMESIDNDSLVIVFAGKAPKKTGDELDKFSPNRNFYYLTGIQEPNHIAVFAKINNEKDI